MSSSARLLAAQETFENLLAPGKKWHISPYLETALSEAQDSCLHFLVPVYQSIFVDLVRGLHLPPTVSLLDVGSPSGIGALAALDALLAWYTSCTLYSVPSLIQHLRVQVAPDGPPAWLRPWRAFCDALEARSREYPEFPALSQVARWARGVLFTPSETPNLVILAAPWKHTEYLARMLDTLPEGAILVGVAWQSDSPDMGRDSVFRWRYEVLQRRIDWVALGPCGQEFGRDLPEMCRICAHGRRERLHRPFTDPLETPPWSYAILAKRASPTEPRPRKPLSAEVLKAKTADSLTLRYIGTWRGHLIQAGHPDETQDDPNNQEWREYLKACPGHSGVGRVAIERPAGMQIPRLRYGQWLSLQDLYIHQPYPQELKAYLVKVRNEASFFAPPKLPPSETFVSEYTPEVQAAVDEIAHRLFGFQSMREFQHKILAQVLCGRDILAIAATGGGKSECFILPAILLPGFTVVVSPLKSLMLDQYEGRIRDRYGLDHLTTFINGDVPFYERWGRLRRLSLGHYKLLYTTPEQLERGYVLDALRQADQQVGFRYLAMDEAHCISQWGHDFRPSYLNIVQRLRDFGLNPCRIAVTATASPLVREDVCRELDLDPREIHQGGNVFVESADRPELNLVVFRTRTTEEKARFIVKTLRDQLGKDGSAIVFMPHTGGPPEKPRDLGAPESDPQPENEGMVSPGVTPFARYLSRQLGVDVAIYHGALDDASPQGTAGAGSPETADDASAGRNFRQEEQRAFMSGRKRIMVATKGFGMGVDKPDIRLVVHRSPPANLEAYLQEAGRAGRDGQLATVMLLYSDDKPKITPVRDEVWLSRTELPSDKEIQEFFIEQKFIRRQDVAAMVAFLRSDYPLRINGALYFTCDQVMAFFDWLTRDPYLAGLTAPYQWPSFPPRTSRSWESPDHRRILDRGYEYQQRQKYISRILNALFNNRPTIGGKVAPLVQSVHAVGIILHQFRLLQPEKIVESPAYFGEKLRQAGIGPEELRRLLPDGDRTALTDLARRLGLSLRETASMVSDIRLCQGHHNDKGLWVGNLLNFQWIEAPRWVEHVKDPYNPAEWREYAGAWTRVKPQGQSKSLDDYFPLRVLNLPIAWEVAPGPGLAYGDWPAYLDEFMRLHDERRQNEWSNFEYLLTQYIGIGQGKPRCLRAVLLGYLKTGEVVIGGNCYGCSVCVPDLRFDRHPVSQRRQAVTRLMPETVDRLQQIERSNREPPDPRLLDQVLEAIAQENALGRSGTAYLESFLARLIQDDPEHHAALWLRLHSLEQDVIHLSPSDALATVERLVHLACKKWERERLSDIVERWRTAPQYQSQQIPLTIQAAELATSLNPKRAAHLWYNLIQQLEREGFEESQSAEWIDRALRRLKALIQKKPDLLTPEQVAEVQLRLARSPATPFQESCDLYQALIRSWAWADVEREISEPRTAHPDAALLAWLSTAPSSSQKQILEWMSTHPSMWTAWSPEVLRALTDHLSPSLKQSPQFLLTSAEHLRGQAGKEALAAEFLIRAWVAGAPLSPAQRDHLTAHLPRLSPDWCRAQLEARADAATLLLELLEADEDRRPLTFWLPFFPSRVVRDLPDDRLVGLLKTPAPQDTPFQEAALRTVAAKINGEDDTLLGQVAQIAAEHPDLALQILQALQTEKHLRPRVARRLFPYILTSRKDPATVAAVLDSLSARPDLLEGEDMLACCLDNWQLLRSETDTWKHFQGSRIEGAVLTPLTDRWMANSRKKPHRLDMLVIILNFVRRRSPPTWKTPPSLLFQALCRAGRFDEAEALLLEYEDIYIPVRGQKQSPQAYMREQKARIPKRTASYEDEYVVLWDLMLKVTR